MGTGRRRQTLKPVRLAVLRRVERWGNETRAYLTGDTATVRQESAGACRDYRMSPDRPDAEARGLRSVGFLGVTYRAAQPELRHPARMHYPCGASGRFPGWSGREKKRDWRRCRPTRREPIRTRR